VEYRIRLREHDDGVWIGTSDSVPGLEVREPTRDGCLGSVRRSVEQAMAGNGGPEPPAFVVEEIPRLAGVAEAAQVMGWDKRRVITYIDRGSFPEPVQTLASGRVWIRSDVQRFATEWKARYAERARRRAIARGES